ncbi:MAG: response regulator [Ignavibacteriales bacterium]|nr:response regulator [Ignavibacteriota bacterium]MCB9247876.1 response regulator [Ignavibacteriales bacterium]
MENKTDILIIDDEKVILDAIQKIVSLDNFSSDACLDVDEALLKLETNTYKLIISDIMMPGKDGFQLLEILRQKKIATPVIITTGFSTLENAVKALYEGAIGFIPKPFTLDELVSIVARGLEYNKIFKNKYSLKARSMDELISYVPCPPKYYRLGFDSWLNNSSEGTIKIGLTDLYLKSINSIQSLDLMKVDEAIYQGGVCAKLTDNNELVHQLLSPASGKIIEINNQLFETNNLLEKDPYFQGWIYRIIPTDIENDKTNLTPCSSDF